VLRNFWISIFMFLDQTGYNGPTSEVNAALLLLRHDVVVLERKYLLLIARSRWSRCPMGYTMVGRWVNLQIM
jgi:hypothetical protein